LDPEEFELGYEVLESLEWASNVIIMLNGRDQEGKPSKNCASYLEAGHDFNSENLTMKYKLTTNFALRSCRQQERLVRYRGFSP